jgi:predicted aspartyl protease
VSGFAPRPQGSGESVNLKSASRCTLVFAFTVAIGLGAFPHPQDRVEVPFEYSRAFGLMLIKVEVNGKPAVMVLDTGSNETIVSPALVIVKQLSSKDAVAMAKGSGYSGIGVIATAFLSIGQLNPKKCQILVVDLSDLSKTLGQEVDGVLGMSILKEFEIVSVDLKHHKLVLN